MIQKAIKIILDLQDQQYEVKNNTFKRFKKFQKKDIK